ncbi:PREDICTED: MARVEL domain-containing protein 1 [Nanorana parkeri]|uniref:MARVEL domain-containing protein 1 n=1 Tax=Nanorana parkeri TaxID=125878 RepID=UPI000854AD47|nr:PREDICTED: MARVEL domain-containing protein 1 [Nanorana parkeri]
MADQGIRNSLSANKKFLRSFPGVVRLMQLATGAAVWIAIATSNFNNTVRFALFVFVFFWLVTLLFYFITLLEKQDLVPLIGGERWLLTNLIYDVLTTAFHIAATAVIIVAIENQSYCNVAKYQGPCYYKIYVVASTFACLCCLCYFSTTIWFSWKKCKGNKSVI